MRDILLPFNRPAGGARLGGHITILVLAIAIGMAGCSVRDELMFDDPAAEIVLIDGPRNAATVGGTLVSGTAKNTGGLTAEDVTAVISVGGSTFTGPVGQDYDQDEGVDNTLEPDESGSFSILVTSGATVTAADITFTFTEPLEE